MKSTSHFAMAHLLYAALEGKGVTLNKSCFLYGNIAPDYIPSLVVTPHFGKTCTRNIEEISRELSVLPLDDSGRIGAEYSKKLGMMCHYLCDYFCFAHNKEFTGGIRQHPAYENSLDQHFRKNWARLLEQDKLQNLSCGRSCAVMMSLLEMEKADYIESGFTFDNDLIYSYRACLSVILAVTAMSRRAFVPGGVYPEEFSLSLKSFASGRGYVFRMFFYKNRNNNIFFLPELQAVS